MESSSPAWPLADSSLEVLAVCCQRALVARWLGSSAQFLSMKTKEQMGFDQPGVVIVDPFAGSLLHKPVGRGVAFLLLSEPQAQQDTQPIRLQGKYGVGPTEEENLLG